MIINHNISAMNTYRQLTINNAFGSKSLEKLSSGLRINRAGDDAAGLAISEKMRGQIRGLNMAAKNAQDGISLIQTAEGALNETHSILQRMRELAVQSSSDTNTEADRSEIQKEINELAAEITRISETTEFNTQALLNGKFNSKFHIGANEAQNVDLVIGDMSAEALKVSGDGQGKATFEITGTGATPGDGNLDNVGIVAGEQTLDVVEIDNVTLADKVVANYGLVNDKGEIVATSQDGKTYVLLDGAYKASELNTAEADANGKIKFDDAVINGTVTLTAAADTGSITDVKATASVDAAGLETGKYTVITGEDAAKILEVELADSSDVRFALKNEAGEVAAVSADGKDWYSVEDIEDFEVTDPIGVATTAGAKAVVTAVTALDETYVLEIKADGGIDVSTQTSADKAITTINKAIETVSAERSKLGAMQNRLDHTINNLTTASENLQAAESRIRDVDYAEAA